MPHPTPERTLTQRIQGGLARRAHALWKRWTSRGPDFPTEAALDWLIAALADSPDDLRAACLETLLDYGCTGAVSEWPRAAGKPDADPTPAIPHEDLASASSLELARSALVWYRQLEMQLADAAFFILEGRQTKDGDFPSPSRLFPNESVRDRILAVKYYLDAAQRRIAASFEAHGQELPTTIDPTDGRMVAATEWMRSLPAKAAVVDVGCGSGRFLLHLIEQFPDAEWTGVDPCPALLNRLPRSVRSHEGTLLRTNLPDAIFDGAFAVESLEHSLVPKHAIRELCRIIRPGGRLLIIDKHRSKQVLSECEPWERWFYPHELTEWLEPFCTNIRVEPISHGEGLGAKGLFLAASASRR